MKRLLVTGALSLALLLAACTPTDEEGTPLATDDLLGTPNVVGTEPGVDLTPLATEPGGDLSTPLATEVAPTEDVEPTTAATEVMPTEMATEAQTAVATVAGTEPATTPEATTAPVGEGQPAVLLSTELIGSQIVDTNGDPIGDVMELLVDEVGMVQYVVFDASTYLDDLGDDTGSAATPAATVDPAATADPAVLTEGVVAAPLTEFEINAGMETGAEINEEQVLVYQGTPESLRTMGGFDVSVLDQDGFIIDTTDTSLDASYDGLIRVSEFSDFDLRNTADEDLGEVEDLVVDVEQGSITYGVVDFGGFLGIAEQTTAVPWDMFLVQQDGDSANFVLDVSDDTLENAPTIDIGSWPSWTERVDGNSAWNPDWDVETRSFWETAS